MEITLGMNAFINTQGFARTGMVKLFFAFYRKMILLISLLFLLPMAFPQWSVMSAVLAEPVSSFLTTCTNAVVFRRFVGKKIPKSA